MSQLSAKYCLNNSEKPADEKEHNPPNDESMKDEETQLLKTKMMQTKQTIGCASCSTAIKVENVSWLAAGQHISIRGILSPVVKYQHHAIVKDVKHVSGTRVTLQLIEFVKTNLRISIFENENTFDLVKDDIYIIHYVHARYTSVKIVERAESMLNESNTDKCKFGSYSLAFNNCEHFATWCVVGKKQSIQVLDISHTIIETISILQHYLNGHRNLRYLYTFLWNSTDEIGGAVTKAIGGLEQGITLGVTAAVYLLFCVFMTFVYAHDYYERHMCHCCLRRKLWDMWLDFSTFCVASTASYLIISLAIPLISFEYVIPLEIMVILLAICLQLHVSKVNRMLQSASPVDKKNIKILSENDVGGDISMTYYVISHDTIVTRHVIQIGRQNISEGNICYVHSQTWKDLCAHEIHLAVDLTKENVSKYDSQSSKTNQKKYVVNRAKKRVLGRKRKKSSHMCGNSGHWAKVKNRQDANCDESNRVDFNEIQLGDAIKFKKWGILVEKKCLDKSSRRKFEIKIMVFQTSKSVVKCKKYRIDLEEKTLMVKKYHPSRGIILALVALMHAFIALRRNTKFRSIGKRRAKQYQLKDTNFRLPNFLKYCMLLQNTS